MRVVAINGSPRKNFNTATLLQYALRGAEEAGAETVMYHIGISVPAEAALPVKAEKGLRMACVY